MLLKVDEDKESKMGNTIYASFADPSMAEKAAGALLDHGVRAEDISVVRSENGQVETTNYATSAPIEADPLATTPDETARYAGNYPSDVVAAGNSVVPNNEVYVAPTNDVYVDPTSDERNDRVDASGDTEAAAKHGISTTTGADAGAGAVKGTAWGAGIGALAAIAAIAIPGFGLVAGGGALATAIGGFLASAGAGAVAGAVTGYLKDQGVDEHVATHYEGTITSGGALLAITLPSGNVAEDEARMILEKYGAGNVNAYATRGYLA